MTMLFKADRTSLALSDAISNASRSASSDGREKASIYMVTIALALFMARPNPGFGAGVPGAPGHPPYPPSTVIESITWHWDAHKTAAPGSDLWPVTWGPDGNLYAAWGDGGGFGGTDHDGRVSMGFARISGGPTDFIGQNVNGGISPLHPASFPCVGNGGGKTGGITCVHGVLYAWENMQDGVYPNVNCRLDWSADLGATWKHSAWLFPKGPGKFKPATFLNFGRDYSDLPASLRGFVYFYGSRQGDDTDTYMGRVPDARLQDRNAYEFLSQLTAGGQPAWSSQVDVAAPVFTDANGGGCSVDYDPGIRRYLAASYHTGPGQLGIFDAPEPWGPWATVYYSDDWGKMGPEGEGLTCSFPQKWMSTDGLTLWCVFSVYGTGAKQGVVAHDRFNVVEAILRPRSGALRVDSAKARHFRDGYSKVHHWDSLQDAPILLWGGVPRPAG